MTVKSDEIPLDYNTSFQSHTFHKPTFIYVTASEDIKLQNCYSELWN